ncbi:hypothetical protein PR048_008874 [Dryococelus australis]|uniref:Uncharacterized protein n=1 Tax=Dryococelus australis TaxID=614101 RepID=A0ABQ9HZD8_9NEOP|nr:hypothetical protein PR048_008874 [Dryococelus australis]
MLVSLVWLRPEGPLVSSSILAEVVTGHLGGPATLRPHAVTGFKMLSISMLSFVYDLVEQTWQLEEQFVPLQVQTALSADALESSHPLSNHVDTPTSIRAMFGTISYNKGKSLNGTASQTGYSKNQYNGTTHLFCGRLQGPHVPRQRLELRSVAAEISLCFSLLRLQVTQHEKDPAPKEIDDIDTRDIICWKTLPVHKGKMDNTAVISVFGNVPLYSSQLLASHLGELHRTRDSFRMIPLPLAGGFSRGYLVSPALAFRRCSIPRFTLIGSQYLDVKSRPNILTPLRRASVLRMMKHFLTKDTFRHGIRRYLSRHGNSTAEPDNLFTALQEQYDEDTQNGTLASGRTLPIFVKTIMDTWVLQRGFPVITVTRSYSTQAATVTQPLPSETRQWQHRHAHIQMVGAPDLHHPGQPQLHLHHRRLLAHRTTSEQLDHQPACQTEPVGALQHPADRCVYLQHCVHSHTVRDHTPALTHCHIGFYRVNYDDRNWALLADYLDSEYYDEIHVLNRAQLLDDAFALARAGTINYTTALKLTKYLTYETEYVPWYSALTALNYVNRRMVGLGEYDHHVFKSYVLKLLDNVYNSLGLEEKSEDTHVTKLHRSLILTWACNYGVKSCTDMARSEFAKLMADPDNYRVNADLKTVVYCNGLRYGGEAEFNFLWNRYLTHNVNTEQVLILGVMGCTKNEALVHSFLRQSVSNDSDIRLQDQSLVYSSVLNNFYGVDYAINFVRENYQEIIDSNNSVNALSSAISGIDGAIYSEEQLSTLREVIANITADIGTNTLLDNLQSAEINLQWLQTHGSMVSRLVKEQDYRLPTNIVPEYYYIVLKPNLDDGSFQFEGRVNITFRVTSNTDRITLHAHDLDIEEDTISVGVDVSAVTVDAVRQFYDIKLQQELQAGRRYQLHMFYKGYHREDMNGFYRTYYYKNGAKRWLASTQFQPTSARRAFPCFDEPGYKAKFKIIIGRTADRHALSNMPLESSDFDDYENVTWDHFEETPMPMSTYLIAFVVSDFGNVSSSDGFYNMWQRADADSQAQYSLDFAPKAMSALERYTGLDYFLPKMDQVAVPDFSAGAMENWGLVTYRERMILLEEGVTPSNYRQSIASIITHEFAHMWFGNLVSPVWWEHSWLNEGFAQFFQFFATAEVEPSWQIDDQFLTSQLHGALSADSLESSHPLTTHVDTPSSISAIFGTIIYSKGASVIRMMEHFLTKYTFRKGLNRYLTRQANSTTHPDYLFTALQDQYDEDKQTETEAGIDTTHRNVPIFMKTIMDTWTLQRGYPVITVTRSYTTNAATIMQSRFLLRRDSGSTDTHTYRWWVPLTYTTQASPNFTSTTADYWLTGLQVSSWTIKMPARQNQWVLFNIQQTGFYRVNYDDRNWALLADYLDSEYYDEIHVLNRAQLLDDAFALARAGTVNYTTALKLTKYLTYETEYVPWYSALTALNYVNRRMVGLGEYDHHVFKSYVLKLLDNVYNSLGLEEKSEDTHVTKLHRNMILTWACNYGVKSCIDMARSEFAKLMADPDNYTVNPDLKTVVYCNGLRYGGEEEFNFLWSRYLAHNVNTEQVLILGVMGCTRNETLAHRHLQRTIINDSYIRTQDLSTVYPSVYNNIYGVDHAISFLRENYQQIIDFNNSTASLASVVSGIAGAIYSEQQLIALREVIANITADIGTNTLLDNLQSAEINLQWLQTHGSTVSRWVKEQDYRLPTNIVPEYYYIVLKPNLDDGSFQFEGRVNITFRVTSNTDRITLHAHDLDIEEDTISVGVDVSAVTVDAVRQFYDIKLEEELEAGKQYQLQMSYTGHLREDMYGFYRTYYYKNGLKRWLASTQFQPTSARRAFPCFDEPGFKAKFKISIGRTPDRHTLSNMPVETSEVDSGNTTWDHFEETPMPMSTYLIAFVISDFSSLSSSDGFYKTWQRSDATSQAQYSVNISPKIMSAIEEYTRLDYFLPKMDQVAVPDFSAGAMENWGLVTYRERLILLEEGITPSNYLLNIASTIAHEFAHMWFGNLVSPVWWEHTWLNEGFARFFEFFTTDAVEPSWKLEQQFVPLQVQTALLTDSLESSHPLSSHVDTPSSVSSIFSTITYNKGASVIRMMEHFLTKDTFRKGLNRYLTRHANSTAVPDYLFTAMQEQYDEDTENETTAAIPTVYRNLPIFVKTIMDTWTLQKGYPVITITRSYTASTATITQRRFLLRRDSGSTDTHTYRWWVPLTYTTQASPNFTSTTADYWLTGLQVSSWTINLPARQNQWVLFNIQQTGFYRVNYDDRNWALLADYLDSEYYDEIHVLNRAQLLDDAFALARAGTINYTTALKLTKYLTYETEYVPWYSALTALNYVNRRLMGLGEYEHHVFKSYVLRLLDNVYNKLGLAEDAADSLVTRLHRNMILTWACNYGVKSCTDMARSEFAKLMADPDNYTIDPDLKTVIYCNGIRYGGEAEFDFLWNRYLTHNVNTEQIVILGVMGCTNNEILAHRHLRKTISEDSFIRSQDMSTVYSSVYNNPYGVDYAISFLRNNYAEIMEFADVCFFAWLQLKEIINNITADIGTNTLLDNLQSAEINLQWLQTHGSTVSRWVKEQDYRLPTNIVPEYYYIVLKPNLDDGSFQFEGRVNITFRVNSNTDRITLHAHDLDIEEDTISVGVDVSAVTVDAVRQFYDIKLQQELQAGRRYQLHMFYKGYHRDETAGFHRSFYYKNGTKRWLASTKFEPTHARRAFPCFDEPALKAKFKMVIGRTIDRHALSNMPLESSEYDEYENVTWDHFEETPMPMSTYLLAFVVSDFKNVSSSDGFFNTWQRADASRRPSTAILTALEEYTGLDYFLPKMDQVAVPDFQSGAMENWGLRSREPEDPDGARVVHETGLFPAKMNQAAVPDIQSGAMENWALVMYRGTRDLTTSCPRWTRWPYWTSSQEPWRTGDSSRTGESSVSVHSKHCREIYLLYEDLVSRFVDKVNVASVIAHELAHMWFGNLVSPKWWSCIWLNEGFAQYFQYFVTASVEPSWRMDELFVLEQMHTALQYDSLESSHPLTYEVNTPSSIRAMFSTVSYNKGTDVLHR